MFQNGTLILRITQMSYQLERTPRSDRINSAATGARAMTRQNYGFRAWIKAANKSSKSANDATPRQGLAVPLLDCVV